MSGKIEYPERIDRLVFVGSGLRGDKQPPRKDAKLAWEAAARGAEPFVEVTMRSDLYRGVHPGTALPQKSRNALGGGQYRNAVASGQVSRIRYSKGTTYDPTLPRYGTDPTQE